MKQIIWLTILSLSLILTACGGSTPTETSNTETSTNIENTTRPKEVEIVESTPELLSDKALLDSIEAVVPTTYIMEMTTTIQGAMTTTMRMSIMEDYSKIEMSGDMYPSTFIMIYNPDERTMYQYSLEDVMGMKFVDIDTSMNPFLEEGREDYSKINLKDFENTFGHNFTARKEMYGGEEVIYIEGNFDTV